MENRDEMLEAIMVILETYDDEYIRHIFEVLTDTVHQEARVMNKTCKKCNTTYKFESISMVFKTTRHIICNFCKQLGDQSHGCNTLCVIINLHRDRSSVCPGIFARVI